MVRRHVSWKFRNGGSASGNGGLAARPIIRQLFHFSLMCSDISRMTHLGHLYFYIDNIGLLILTLAEGFLTLGLKAGHIPRVQYKSCLTKLSDMRQSCLQPCRPHKRCHVVSCPVVDRTLAGGKKAHLRFSRWEWIARQHPWHKSGENLAGEIVAGYRHNHWSQLAKFIWILCSAAPLEKPSPAPSPHELSFAQLWWLMGPDSWVPSAAPCGTASSGSLELPVLKCCFFPTVPWICTTSLSTSFG